MGLCEALHHTLAQLEGLHRPYRMSQTRRSRLRPAGDRINELGPAAPQAPAPKQRFCWAKLGKMGGLSGDFRPEQSLDASFRDASREETAATFGSGKVGHDGWKSDKHAIRLQQSAEWRETVRHSGRNLSKEENKIQTSESLSSSSESR